MDNDAKNFVQLVRDIVIQELNNRSCDAVCMIDSVNPDGTLNIYVLPDTSTVISNITNESRYDFKKGDTGLLYIVRNKLSNSFVFAKYGATKLS